MTIRVADRAASRGASTTRCSSRWASSTTYSDARFAEWDDFSLTRGRRRAPGHARAAHRLRRALARARRRLLARRARGGLPRRRRAGAAAASTATTTTAASCSTPTATAPRRSTTAEIRPPGHIDHLWIRVADVPAAAALLRPRRALRRLPAQGRRARARPLRRRRRLVLARGRHADRARPPRLPGDRERDGRRLPSRGDRRRLPRQRRRPASARATTRATTAPTCSTPTPTTSRSSTTTASR